MNFSRIVGHWLMPLTRMRSLMTFMGFGSRELPPPHLDWASFYVMDESFSVHHLKYLSSPLLTFRTAYIRPFFFLIFIYHGPAVSVCLPTCIAHQYFHLSPPQLPLSTVSVLHRWQLGKHSRRGGATVICFPDGARVVMTPRQIGPRLRLVRF